MASPEDAPQDDEPRYVLITECLQNDFVLNAQCRLVAPRGGRAGGAARPRGGRVSASEGIRRFPAKAVAAGRSGCSSTQTIGRRMRGEDGHGVLHVINIRDWHVPDDNYDFERRRYGAHCEAGTWGAGYVDGLERWLDPAGSAAGRGGAVLRAGKRPQQYVLEPGQAPFR